MAEMLRRPTRVLLGGDFSHRDFVGMRMWLEKNCDVVESAQTATLDCGASPDLILLCQSRPGQFSQDDVESLHRSAPLAGLLAVLGSWCEGELRSGRPWHGIERVYWYDAIGRIEWLLDPSRQLGSRTQTPAERIARQIQRLPTVSSPLAGLIVAPRHEFAALADVCRAVGIVPHRCGMADPLPQVDLTLVLLAVDDVASLGSGDVVVRLRQAWPAARCIALMNFPRRDEIAALESAGCDAVLGKPWLLSDLLGSCGGILGEASRRKAAV